MGESRTPAEFAGKIRKAAEEIDKQRAKSFKALGPVMSTIFERQVAGDLGGDNTFSGWPKAPINPQVTQKSDTLLSFAPARRSLGPTRVAEQGRQEPTQGPRITSGGKSGKRKVSRARAKRYSGSTKPKNTWTHTTEEIAKVLPPKLRTDFIGAAERVFQ